MKFFKDRSKLNLKLYVILLFVFLVGIVFAAQLDAQHPTCSESELRAKGIGLTSACAAHEAGVILTCGSQPTIWSVSKIPDGAFSAGPGTEMTNMINRLGLGSDCGRCKALAAEMDRGGPEWVRQNRNYVVQRTINNAKNLGHRMGPIQRAGVRILIQKAIRRSRN